MNRYAGTAKMSRLGSRKATLLACFLLLTNGFLQPLPGSEPFRSDVEYIEWYLESQGYTTDPEALRKLILEPSPTLPGGLLRGEAAALIGLRGDSGSCTTLLGVALDQEASIVLRTNSALALGRLGASRTAISILRNLLAEAEASISADDVQCRYLDPCAFRSDIATALIELGALDTFDALIYEATGDQRKLAVGNLLKALKWGEMPQEYVDRVAKIAKELLVPGAPRSSTAVTISGVLVQHYGVSGDFFMEMLEPMAEGSGERRSDQLLAADLLAWLRREVGAKSSELTMPPKRWGRCDDRDLEIERQKGPDATDLEGPPSLDGVAPPGRLWSRDDARRRQRRTSAAQLDRRRSAS